MAEKGKLLRTHPKSLMVLTPLSTSFMIRTRLSVCSATCFRSCPVLRPKNAWTGICTALR